MPIKQFRRKPDVIQAVEWTGGNETEVRAFLNGSELTAKVSPDNPMVLIVQKLGSEYSTELERGDYFYKSPYGDISPCSKNLFEAAYEEMT